MHELGVVFHIIDDVTEVGRENDLPLVQFVDEKGKRIT